MSEKIIGTLTDRIRERLRKRLGLKPPCPTCGHSTLRIPTEALASIGIGQAVIFKFLGGTQVKSDTLDRISAWLDAQVEKDTKK